MVYNSIFVNFLGIRKLSKTFFGCCSECFLSFFVWVANLQNQAFDIQTAKEKREDPESGLPATDYLNRSLTNYSGIDPPNYSQISNAKRKNRLYPNLSSFVRSLSDDSIVYKPTKFSVPPSDLILPQTRVTPHSLLKPEPQKDFKLKPEQNFNFESPQKLDVTPLTPWSSPWNVPRFPHTLFKKLAPVPSNANTQIDSSFAPSTVIQSTPIRRKQNVSFSVPASLYDKSLNPFEEESETEEGKAITPDQVSTKSFVDCAVQTTIEHETRSSIFDNLDPEIAKYFLRSPQKSAKHNHSKERLSHRRLSFDSVSSHSSSLIFPSPPSSPLPSISSSPLSPSPPSFSPFSSSFALLSSSPPHQISLPPPSPSLSNSLNFYTVNDSFGQLTFPSHHSFVLRAMQLPCDTLITSSSCPTLNLIRPSNAIQTFPIFRLSKFLDNIPSGTNSLPRNFRIKNLERFKIPVETKKRNRDGAINPANILPDRLRKTKKKKRKSPKWQ